MERSNGGRELADFRRRLVLFCRGENRIREPVRPRVSFIRGDEWKGN